MKFYIAIYVCNKYFLTLIIYFWIFFKLYLYKILVNIVIAKIDIKVKKKYQLIYKYIILY